MAAALIYMSQLVAHSPQPAASSSKLSAAYQNAIKAPHRYAVQGSDTTMLPMAAALPGQTFLAADLKFPACSLLLFFIYFTHNQNSPSCAV